MAQIKSTVALAPALGGGGTAPGLLFPGAALGLGGTPGTLFGTVAPAAAAAAAAPATATATTGAPGAATAGGAKANQGGRNGAGKPAAHVQHPATVTKIINSVERVIPGLVWIALGVALGLAAIGGASAFRSSRRARKQAGAFAAVSAAALTDPLTGVLNRRGFNDAVERELARSRRYGRPFVLAYVDVRGLKQVNDTAGHLAGDRLLKEVALIMTNSARAADVVGRLGGDELGLLLAEQSPHGAAAVTERIRTQVPVSRARMDLSAPWDLTIGIAAFPEDGDTFDELLHVADRRLYEQRGIALPGQEPQPPANAPLS